MMKKIAFFLALGLMVLSSCNSSEKLLYFQDLQSGESLSTQAIEPLKFKPNDKLSIIVSSAATPEVAMNYNLAVAQRNIGAASSTSSSNGVGIYTVDEHGDIDIPSLGRVHVADLTRSEVALKVQDLFKQGILNDAVVTVNSYDQFITVTGEVAKPGRININRDNLTLLEAIGMAGDLTIYGRRDRVLVLRQEGNETKSYYVDLRTKDVMNSPVYNLRQNDYIYVEPNNVRMGQSTSHENSLRQIGTWMSITSFLTTLAILIFK